MDIQIVKANPTDAIKILDYLKQVGSETDNLTFGKEGIDFTPEQEAEYIGKIANSTDSIMILAKNKDEIVGIASLNRSPSRMNHRGEFGISVLKQFWGNGVGSQLLSRIIQYAKQNSFQAIDLQVRSDNIRAIRLYEKFGFIKIGEHPAFFNINNKDIPFTYMLLKV